MIHQKKSIVIPDCPCCRYFFENEKDNKCSAFPDGIPDNYFWGKIYVRDLKECNNGYKYEEIKLYQDDCPD